MRYCLIIDNTDQEEAITSMKSISKERSFPITCFFFNPTTNENCRRTEVDVKGKPTIYLDKEKILMELVSLFKYQQIDVVAIDYKLDDPEIDGLDLVNFLRQKNWKGIDDYVMYSSDSEELKDKLHKAVLKVINDKNELSSLIKDYNRINPVDVFNRSQKHKDDYYIERLFGFMKINKPNLSSKFSQKLSQHENMTLKTIFPRFHDKPLSALAELVLKKTEECDDFENEFLDRCIDHFIDLKE